MIRVKGYWIFIIGFCFVCVLPVSTSSSNLELSVRPYDLVSARYEMIMFLVPLKTQFD